jgi:hypothetical protein
MRAHGHATLRTSWNVGLDLEAIVLIAAGTKLKCEGWFNAGSRCQGERSSGGRWPFYRHRGDLPQSSCRRRPLKVVIPSLPHCQTEID